MSGIMTRNEQPPRSEGSRFGQRIRRRYADLLHLCQNSALQRTQLQALLQALLTQGFDTGAALRITRQLAWSACCTWTATNRPRWAK